MSSPTLNFKQMNPFPGLLPFQEQDASRFFGRDREVEDLLARLTSRRLLAVIGVSGCGKSSLVRAGLVPVLKMGVAVNLSSCWQILTIKPGRDPLGALREALQMPNNWPTTSFDLIDEVKNNFLEGDKALLLIVDQFEEIFSFRDQTLYQDGGNRASLFVNLLLKAVEQREVPIYILLTMRTDFLGKCAQFRGLPEALNDCYYLVPRMTRLQQQQAIEQPLLDQVVSIDPALIQRLLNDSAEDPDHLPILQHLLKRLWENWLARENRGPIALKDYDAVGGWKEALNKDAETILEEYKTDEENIRQVFQWITERGTGDKPIRRPRSFAECVEISGLDRVHLKQIMRKFQERGLLWPSDLSDQSLVDLPHESVMWQWARLKRWIDEEAAQAVELPFLLQSALQKNPLTGLTLESALEWQVELQKQRHSALRYLSHKELELTEAWIVQSKHIQKTRRRRRMWLLGVFGVLALSFAIITTLFSWKQQNLEEAWKLSARAESSLATDPERSLILGLYSWGKQQTMVEGLNDVLFEAILQSHSRLTLQGHQKEARGIVWSPDGSKLATASEDKTARVWDAGTGRELLILRGHQGPVWNIAWSPDGSKLATASEDKTARVWEAGTGRELLILRGHQHAVRSIAWSPDGTKLATASEDQTARIWEAGTGRELILLRGHQSVVWSVAWSPDGSKLATAGEDKMGTVWEVATGHQMQVLRGHAATIRGITWSPDSSRLATASDDHTAKIWKLGTSREVRTLRGHQGYVASIAWSRDGTKLATAGYDGIAKVWEVSTGQEVLSLRGHHGRIWSIAWSPDGSGLATASDDHMAKIWDLDVRQDSLVLRGHRGRIWSIAWSPDSAKLASASDDHTTKIWKADMGSVVRTLHSQAAIVSVAWSPDGTKLAFAGDDKTTTVWEVNNGKKLFRLSGHLGSIGCIAWSPNGRELATASDDKTARIWEIATGRELHRLSGHLDHVVGIAWSPDGRKVATASWDKTAKIWEAATGNELFTLTGHQGRVVGIAWSPDGRKLATASSDTTAKIWYADSGRELRTLRGHQNSVVSVTWSKDGSRLATASHDQTVKIWEEGSDRVLLTLYSHEGPVINIDWAPDGRHLALATDPNVAQVYTIDLTLSELLRRASSRITRELTPDECQHYLNKNICPPLPDLP